MLAPAANFVHHVPNMLNDNKVNLDIWLDRARRKATYEIKFASVLFRNRYFNTQEGGIRMFSCERGHTKTHGHIT